MFPETEKTALEAERAALVAKGLNLAPHEHVRLSHTQYRLEAYYGSDLDESLDFANYLQQRESRRGLRQD